MRYTHAFGVIKVCLNMLSSSQCVEYLHLQLGQLEGSRCRKRNPRLNSINHAITDSAIYIFKTLVIFLTSQTGLILGSTTRQEITDFMIRHARLSNLKEITPSKYKHVVKIKIREEICSIPR